MRMVTLARESEGLTQVALAHVLGVSQGFVSQMEHGLEEPNNSIIEMMSRELNFPVEFFFQPEIPIGEGLVDFFHRRRQTLPKKPLKRAHALANIVRFEVLRLFSNTELTDVQPFPTFGSDEHTPVEAAELTRATWRLPHGPVLDLTAQIESAGVPVIQVSLGHEKLSAISMPGFEDRHIILLNNMMPASHLRFAVAHELGHLVMHTGHVTQSMESEADEFASEFLMPMADIRNQLAHLRFGDLGDLKRQWHTSLAALIRRAYSLDTITQRQYTYMNMQLNRLPQGRKLEPGEFPHEQPRLVRHVIDYFKEQLSYTLSDIAQVMVTTEETLRTRYLGEAGVRLRAVGAVGRGNVIQLPGLPPA